MRKNKNVSRASIRGFIRGQLIDGKTKKIVGDSGWVENKLTNDGLQNLAKLLGGIAGSYIVGYAVLGTQTAAFDMSQTALIGTTNSFASLDISTSGSTLICTASFASSNLGASCEVGAAALHKTNALSSLEAGQTFATSQWNTNQDFNLTYQIQFQTA